MRVLYIDVDSLRPDHLGCYGYHRDTSPNLDRLAASGVRFDEVYASDTPCLPSRTALFSGRLGVHNGVVTHGGSAAEPRGEGPHRGFASGLTYTSWPSMMRRRGMRTASISTFAERHAAWWQLAGFMEWVNLGTMGLERADQVSAAALGWLDRHGEEDDWFLHVQFWDPHTPYRTPGGDPFAGDELPEWLTLSELEIHRSGPGPHSAREMTGFEPQPWMQRIFPRQPIEAKTMDDVRAMFDGYDAGVRYADEHIGRIIDAVSDDVAVVVSADHGENLGELNVYGDHHTADLITARVPLIVRWPGIDGGWVDDGLHYQVDLAATLVELAGAEVPEHWDGSSFAEALRDGLTAGRDHLVLSHGAWTVQRSVRWGDHLLVRTLHDGYHGYPETMLFDVATDPHETHDLSSREPALVNRGSEMLKRWLNQHVQGGDPLEVVLEEGGPWHTRGHLKDYLERLRETGREEWADRIAARHPDEIDLEPTPTIPNAYMEMLRLG